MTTDTRIMPMTSQYGAYEIRPIIDADASQLRALVIETLASFGMSGEGCAAYDAELADLPNYRDNTPGSQFFAIVPLETPETVLGLIGYEPLKGETERAVHQVASEVQRMAEIVKFYFRPVLRGKGLGRFALEHVLAQCQYEGYTHAYMETAPHLLAVPLFKKLGFTPTTKQGNNGHTHPDITVFMIKSLMP
ncbi:MAG: GNAT family N-acetyltransferase [Vampirovibrionales bacterium]